MADDEQRKQAIERLQAKQNLQKSAVSFAGVAILLVVIWLAAGQGFFWPIFPIAGLGIALAMQAFGIWGQKAISEEDIQREMGRGGPGV
jgi:uncharacterized membrane protein